MRHAVFLIPGFFGFARLGGIEYFRHVDTWLQKLFAEQGHEVRTVPVKTLPTGSIRRRALLLAEAINAAGIEPDEKLHVLGHSTGGLDARLLVSPGVSLDPRADRLEARVESVVTLATPNHGTPVASFFTNLAGKHLLLAMSLLMILSMRGVGGMSYAWIGKLLSYVTRFDDLLGLDNTLLDYLAEQLLADLDRQRRQEIISFLNQVSNDSGALLQLTPEAMDIFNAATIDNADVRYYSYVTTVPDPSVLIALRRARDPYFPPSYALFAALHRLASNGSKRYPFPPFPKALESAAHRVWGRVPNLRSNDGVVPACSQPWGQVAGLIRGDHLDVCGHFYGQHEETQHTDWLRSGASFRHESFVALFRDITARFLQLPPPPSDAPGFVSVV